MDESMNIAYRTIDVIYSPMPGVVACKVRCPDAFVAGPVTRWEVFEDRTKVYGMTEGLYQRYVTGGDD